MAAARKMDELLVSWLGSDAVYESILELIENYRAAAHQQEEGLPENDGEYKDNNNSVETEDDDDDDIFEKSSTQSGNTSGSYSSLSVGSHPRTIIPPFYPRTTQSGEPPAVRSRRRTPPRQHESWDPLPPVDKTELLQSSSSANNNSTLLLKERALLGVKDRTNNRTPPPPPPPPPSAGGDSDSLSAAGQQQQQQEEEEQVVCVRDQVQFIYNEIGQDPPLTSPSSLHSDDDEDDDDDDSVHDIHMQSGGGGAHQHQRAGSEQRLRRKYLTVDAFVRVTKDVCRFPSFFNVPLYQRILYLWNTKTTSSNNTSSKKHNKDNTNIDDAPPLAMEVVTYDMFEWYWRLEIEPYDRSDCFFRLAKQPQNEYIARNDFLPFIAALIKDHPGLEFLSPHSEFQEKYASTVIARIFYSVNTSHDGKITSRQLRRSDLLEALDQVDLEEDINKVTRYLSYEHFYVLYCRFWELDHDRDLRISREDLLKYGDHSLSHMIVDRIFDAAPRPFEGEYPNRDFLTYESFIYFMLSEEDKSNEVAVRYWFQCVDVDGDGKLNNMEMRSFYAVQLHRMQCMGQESVPFEDMLCQMMDMIKPASSDHFIAEDFLQPHCCLVSGALFDALFNLNKYLLFEQRDPFVERQKREDEFECDWDRFACIEYNRLAMEEEVREEEAMEIDWVTVDEDDEAGGGGAAGSATAAAAGGGAGSGGGGGNQSYGGQAGGAAGGISGVSEAPF